MIVVIHEPESGFTATLLTHKTLHELRCLPQEGRERRKREHSDEEQSDDDGEAKQRRKTGREHGQLNFGAGALKEGLNLAPSFSWRCELCQITVKSEALKHQHLEGAAHRKVCHTSSHSRCALMSG